MTEVTQASKGGGGRTYCLFDSHAEELRIGKASAGIVRLQAHKLALYLCNGIANCVGKV